MTVPDIRDIKGPIAIPPGWLLPAVVVGGGALVGLVAYLLVRWWRRRRTRVAPPRTPEEIALERLERARRLMEPARAREFGAAVSDAVRLYVEDRFRARAAHRTTEEFLRDLARGDEPALVRQRELLGDFLAHCDLAKFARLPLAHPEMEAMHASARRFVEAARPAADAAAQGS
ncbi:MAG TPA: DUF4381 family protein [Candidatus Binatia bacterium]|nr:DUF4381 family protein [Candidatus Binatia bacterium]